jgi:hypothetical protein
LVLHVAFQFWRASQHPEEIKVAAWLSIASSVLLVSSPILILDEGGDGKTYAVFGTIQSPPEMYYDFGFFLFFLGMYFSVLTTFTSARSSNSKKIEEDAS